MNRIIRTSMAVIAIASLITWAGCSKNNHQDLSSESNQQSISGANITASNLLLGRTEISSTEVPALCGTVLIKHFVKNTTGCGTIQVGNDATDYYITISGYTGWNLKDIRLYLGTEAGIPVNSGNGMPKHNDFPVQKNFSNPCPGTWTMKVPISELGNNFWVSARVSFVAPNNATQTLWSEGILFPPSNNGSKFSYDLQTCIIDEGCGYGQGYWFGNGNHPWPDVNGNNSGVVTIGAEHYTREEARNIWWANNGQCPGIPNAKKAFAFVASVRLNGASIKGNATLWSDVTTADAWLESLERLSPANICDHPAAPASVMNAVARIGEWLDAHDCE